MGALTAPPGRPAPTKNCPHFSAVAVKQKIIITIINKKKEETHSKKITDKHFFKHFNVLNIYILHAKGNRRRCTRLTLKHV